MSNAMETGFRFRGQRFGGEGLGHVGISQWYIGAMYGLYGSCGYHPK